MREILFRGKRADNGEWVEGCGIIATENWVSIFTVIDDIDENSSEVNEIEILPETVGQYTGLTDKNGKKIFEGDILKGCYDEDNPEEYTVVVVFWDNGWHIQQDNRIPDPLEEYDGRICEVIGNIHDNPELPKGGGENG